MADNPQFWVLDVTEGNDGNYYFFHYELHYSEWKKYKAQYLEQMNGRVYKVSVTDYAKDYHPSVLLNAYLLGVRNGTVSTYRLD